MDKLTADQARKLAMEATEHLPSFELKREMYLSIKQAALKGKRSLFFKYYESPGKSILAKVMEMLEADGYKNKRC